MASVYRKTVTRKLPEKAELVTRKGQRLALWRDRTGKRQTALVVEGRDGSLRIRTEAGTYTAKYRDGAGVVREVATGCKSKSAALAVLKELTDRAECVRSGILSASDDAVRDWLSTPIADSLADYLTHLRSKNRSNSHIADCDRLAKRVFSECNMYNLRDIATLPIEHWLAERMTEGIAPRTRNSYLQAVRGFCRWCVSSSRLPDDPTARIEKLDDKADSRRNRRSMTAEELERLLYVARWRPLAERGRLSEAKSPDERNKRRDTWRLVPLTAATFDSAIEKRGSVLRRNQKLSHNSKHSGDKGH